MFTDFEVRVTFPGRVLSASGSGRIEGNTVTWSDPKDMYLEEGLRATASADPDLSWLWLTLGVIALAGAGAGIVLGARSRRAAPSPNACAWECGSRPKRSIRAQPPGFSTSGLPCRMS